MKALLIFSAVAAASVATTLSAQGVTSRPDSTCTKYSDGRVECRVFRSRVLGDSAFGNRIFYRMDSAMAKRAALGLELRATGTRRDTLGVFVEAVTPKGPAEAAGIVEGDRIAAINGVDLRTSVADVDDSYTDELASHRLTREVQKLTPGSRVNLRVYSGGRFRDIAMVAGKASDIMRLGNRLNIGFPGAGGAMRIDGPGGIMRLDGPGGMMFGPDMQMMRERLEPLLRERLQNLPNRIQLRAPIRFRMLNGNRVLIDAETIPELDEGMLLDLDDDPIDIDSVIEPVTAETIKDLAATAIRDAQSALKQLAVDGVV